MAKRPSPAEFKLNVPSATIRPAPAPTSAPVPVPKTAATPPGGKPARTSVPPGCKSLTFYPSRDAWLQVRMLAGKEDRTAHDLMLEALDMLLLQRGLTPNARPVRSEEAA